MFLVIDIKKIVFLAAFFSGFCLFGQTNDEESIAEVDSVKFNSNRHRTVRKTGDKSYKLGDIYGAAAYYNKFLRNSDSLYSGEDEIMPARIASLYVKYQYKLAEAYRLSRDYVNAELNYFLVFQAKPKKYPEAQFYLAQMELINGKYDKALEHFTQFKEVLSSTKIDKKEVDLYIASCEAAPEIIKEQLKVKIFHPDTSVNKVQVELSPVPLNDSILLYSSLRSDTNIYVNQDDSLSLIPRRKFYTAKKRNDSTWVSQGEYAEGWFNLKDTENGNGCFNRDSSQFYFSRGLRNINGELTFHLYSANREEGDFWSEPIKLNDKINLKGFHSTQPTIGSLVDGDEEISVLYFVSNREEKSLGGWDIWYSEYNSEKNSWDDPKNAGSLINTALDEMSPNYDQNTKTLYFSSQGWPGVGGFDIFKATGELDDWTEPENIGYPINTSVDELYFVLESSGESGYFVSNREGSVSIKNPTCCDDIYYFRENDLISIAIQGNMYEIAATNDNLDTVPTSEFVLTLFVLDDSLNNEEIMIKSLFPNDDGSYFIDLEKGKNYSIRSSADHYFSAKFDFSTKNISSSDTLKKDFFMQRHSQLPILVKDIYYEFDKYNLLDSSKTVIDTTIYQILVDNENIIIEIGSHTDARGTDAYNVVLSQNRAQSVVDYLVNKGVDKKRIRAKGYGEKFPIYPNSNPDGSDNPQGRQMNRRTEFKVIGTIEGVSEIIYTK